MHVKTVRAGVKGFAGPLTKYGEITRTNLQNHLVYVLDLLWRSIFLIVVVYIFSQLWKTAYSTMGLKVVDGYSLPQMLWYFMFAETIVLSHPALSDTIDQEVKQGSIAYALTKPYSYVLYHYCVFASEVAVRWLINAAVGSAVVYLVTRQSPVNPAGLPLLAVSLLLSLTVQFCLMMAIGLLAFWIEDTRSVYFIYQKLLFILGGMLLPLEVYPEFMQRLAYLLPLRYIVHGPAKAFVRFNPALWVQLTAGQLGWALLLAVLLGCLYRMGVKRLNVNGG